MIIHRMHLPRSSATGRESTAPSPSQNRTRSKLNAKYFSLRSFGMGSYEPSCSITGENCSLYCCKYGKRRAKGFENVHLQQRCIAASELTSATTMWKNSRLVHPWRTNRIAFLVVGKNVPIPLAGYNAIVQSNLLSISNWHQNSRTNERVEVMELEISQVLTYHMWEPV